MIVRRKFRHGRIDYFINAYVRYGRREVYVTARGLMELWQSRCLTYLFAFTVNTIENSLVSRVGESRLLSGLLVAFVTSTETFGAEVEGITERLVDACEGLAAGHEDLCIWLVIYIIGVTTMSVDEVESKYGDHVPVQRLLSTPLGA
jgi:hypothetical protein